MAASSRVGRSVGWRSVVQRGVQSGIDTAAEISDVVAQKLAAMADPRAKVLRKRRWALRLGLFFAAATGFWALVTAVLASWSTPAWVLIITGLIAAGAAFPATLLFMRYRWLRREPLPPTGQAARRQPPRGSAARQPMASLTSSERGLFALLGVLERGRMLPADELRDIATAARQAAATMAATADEVVAMERAASAAPQARAHLAPTINAFTVQLHQGARQYGEMVTAAAQLVSSVNSGPDPFPGSLRSCPPDRFPGSLRSCPPEPNSPMTAQRYRDELVGATDRMLGWAQAYSELGQLRGA